MSHPILALQAALVAALRADAALAALIGDAVFDSPPKGRQPPYLVIARHDVAPNDGDDAPGHVHRLVLHAWAEGPGRRPVLALAERLLAVALQAPLAAAGLRVTHRRHERTETVAESGSGRMRAAVSLRLFTEPAP